MIRYEPSPFRHLFHGLFVGTAVALTGVAIASLFDSPAPARRLRRRVRNTTNYELRNRGKVVYHGITNDLERRIAEHERSGKLFDEVVKVGTAVTRGSARTYERRQIATYARRYRRPPKYNLCA